MKYGFVKAAAVSPNLKLADVKFNAAEILSEIKTLTEKGAEVAAFPELSLCGYTCGDLFFSAELLSATEEAAGYLAEESAKINKNLLFFVGLPVEKNGALYNCAAAICGGKILALIPKTALPNYNEFYERRYFTPAENKPCETVTFAGQETLFGKNVLVCNGEIYGFRKMKSALIEKGYTFKSDSDCEILLPLYKEYGLKTFSMLDAEYALILYDGESGKIIAARDPI
ncbi:MAG: nitrilase-related carbon-nitrogen hydrolase, partial [Candidatus Scatosoma sp.]